MSLIKKLPYDDFKIHEKDICWIKETHPFSAYKTEFKGYQGNWSGDKDL